MNKLNRIFTIDVRKEFLPAWSNPIFHAFVVDERNGLLYSLISHVLFSFSISNFPEFAGDKIDAVYINSVSFDKQNGLLAIGGHSQSGNPPLKLFDTKNDDFRWVTNSVSGNFMGRAKGFVSSLKRRYGENIASHEIFSTNHVAICEGGNFLVATTSGPANKTNKELDSPRWDFKENLSLKKIDINGKLLAQNDDIAPSNMIIYRGGGRIAATSENYLIDINADTLEIIKVNEIAESAISSICLANNGLIVVGTVEGEIIAFDFDFNVVWRSIIDSMINCVRPFSGNSVIAGTNIGDLIVFNDIGNVDIHERVSESIRDIGFLHDGRHLLVGCKNMDIHIFCNNAIELNDKKIFEWENRLLEAKQSVYTSTSSLTNARVFLSYSSEDKEFARKLETRMQEVGISCWRDEHQLVAGRITKQLKKAILENDVLLVVLSTNSILSDWVRWEIDSARQQEKTAKKDIICPVTLDNAWRDWDDDPVLKREIEKYHIVSFAEHQSSDNFESSFSRLVKGLKENYHIDTIKKA